MRLRRPFRRRPSWRLLLCGGMLLLVAGRFAQNAPSDPALDDRALLRRGDANVVSVRADGTLLVGQRDERGHRSVFPVRLLGVTFLPQQEPAAAACLRRELDSPGVRIQLDQRRIDDARRFLAYVYHGDTLLNELVIQNGRATAENYPGDALAITRRLRAAEKQARSRRRGAWQSPAR